MEFREANGYVVKAEYQVYRYQPQLARLRARWALLVVGQDSLEQAADVCELGFGQGMSINIDAAGDASVSYWGTDFIAAQAQSAQRIAGIAGAGATLESQSFADFCQRADLPDFDFIQLHGIWSWVSPEVREELIAFFQRKLKSGGVLYLGYNTLPGWGPSMALRQLLVRHTEASPLRGIDVLDHVEASLGFAEQVLALKPQYLVANPSVDSLFKEVMSGERSYLAHEYFHKHWTPFFFADIAVQLAPAGLSYAGPAEMLKHFDSVCLTPEQQKLLAFIVDPVLRETTRDLFVNEWFRKDYWVKDARRLSAPDRDERLRAMRVVLSQPRPSVQLAISGPQGTATLLPEVHDPVLDLLEQTGGRPCRIGELELRLLERHPQYGLPHLVQALNALIGLRCVEPAHASDEQIDAARAACLRLNREICRQSRDNKELNALASPVTGSGIEVPRLFLLCLAMRAEGQDTPESWAEGVAQYLLDRDEPLPNDGEPLDATTTQAELRRQAQTLHDDYLPVYRALGMV